MSYTQVPFMLCCYSTCVYYRFHAHTSFSCFTLHMEVYFMSYCSVYPFMLRLYDGLWMPSRKPSAAHLLGGNCIIETLCALHLL